MISMTSATHCIVTSNVLTVTDETCQIMFRCLNIKLFLIVALKLSIFSPFLHVVHVNLLHLASSHFQDIQLISKYIRFEQILKMMEAWTKILCYQFEYHNFHLFSCINLD